MRQIMTALLAVAVGIAGCASTPANQGYPKEILLGVFEGRLPCADCPGIDTRLTLTQEGKYVDIGHFTLKQTYLDRSVQPLESRGEWTVIKGTAQDDNAVVYELRPGPSKRILYFLKMGDRKVKLLDKDGNEIDPQLDFSLSRVQ
ncbi:MAG TPA: copper resistance protein NlpE [bacterium]|nr:copper resistance protein NlpE [bacterium]